MSEDERMTVAPSFSFLSSQLFSFTGAVASARLCLRMLQGGTASPMYLQAKVSDAKSLGSDTKHVPQIYSGVNQPLSLGMGLSSRAGLP